MNKILCYVLLSLISSVVSQTKVSSTCNTPANKTGLCIPLRECASLFNQVLKGNELTADEIQYLTRSQCGYKDNQPLVCCPDSTNVNTVLPQPGKCGNNPMYRIIRGIMADLDTYSWMALLEYTKPNNTKGFHCIGVLISKRHVLTAAHCLRDKTIPSTWKVTGVRLGEYDLLKDMDCENYGEVIDCNPAVIDIPISEQIIHELYDPLSKNRGNDIALLKLQSDVEYSDLVHPICLPFSQKLRNVTYDNTWLEVVGWNTNTSEYSVKLTGFVNTITNAQCNKMYNGVGIFLTDRAICGKSRPLSYDSCKGLPGTPIMGIMADEGVAYWYLAGIEAFGPSVCGQEAWPNVYTGISAYIDWIESKVLV